MSDVQASGVEQFRDRFGSTRSGNGFTYTPTARVGKWERVRFWVGGSSTEKGWPACVYRSEKEGRDSERRCHHFSSALEAYAAMLGWAERQGWAVTSELSKPSAVRRPPPIPEELEGTQDFDLLLSFEDAESISLTDSMWHGAKDYDDWDPQDWEQHASRAEPHGFC